MVGVYSCRDVIVVFREIQRDNYYRRSAVINRRKACPGRALRQQKSARNPGAVAAIEPERRRAAGGGRRS